MSKNVRTGLIAVALLIVFFNTSTSAQEGDQVINGTRVHTVIDQQRGVATFSNSCGTQSLTQGQLQQGAIPSNIIPCPRPNQSPGNQRGEERTTTPQIPTPQREPPQTQAPPRDVYAEANALIQKGGNAAQASNFSEAAAAYKKAAQVLEAAGKNADSARRLYALATCNGDMRTLQRTIAAGKALSITAITDIDPQFETMCRNAGSLGAFESSRQLLKTAREAEMRQAAKTPQVRQSAVPTPPNQQGEIQRVAAQLSQGQNSTSCSTITDKDHPSAGPCKQAQSTLDAARFAKSTNASLAKERYKDAAEMFQAIGDFTMAATTLIEGGVPPSALQTSNNVTRVGSEGSEVIKMDPKSCEATTADEIKKLGAKIDEIRKREPSIGEGPQVDVGSCNSRLRKLFGGSESLRTFANIASFQEERSCLELKINYLRKACECSKHGMTFSTNEALQDQTLEAYSAIRKLDEKWRKKGIQNPVIYKIVTEAAEKRDCYNLQTIETLRGTEHILEGVLAQTPDGLAR